MKLLSESHRSTFSGLSRCKSSTSVVLMEILYRKTTLQIPKRRISLQGRADIFSDKEGELTFCDTSASELFLYSRSSLTCQPLPLHLLSFYPIFPSPPGTKRLDPLNLDITHFDLVKMQTGPDIIIAPSVQKAFTRVSSWIHSQPRYYDFGSLSSPLLPALPPLET